ncbi:C-terminal binding protein [Singulisphaera sp. GP187]|uniref:C-terminal binding protein n=1 Tax=Singulisphaera sp. GP187 TaxID=1882752 RepID=UPI000925F388|nr:C-terminal binding protein [Singulisphaera sp. GP187]SIO14811.1 C-terminal binding protein [Singulisphaera sp. GP187]
MSSAFKVVITDFLDETSIEAPILGDLAQVELARATDEASLARFLPGADALITYHEIALLGESTFANAPQCKCIVRAGVGYNNVDRTAAARHGVIVCNVPDYGTEEVADHAIMFLLALARQLVPSHEAIRAGGWDYRTVLGTPRLRGKTLGLVGCGRIGTATALRAKAFGLDVLFYDPLVPQGVDKALGIRRAHRLEELLEQSDYVSLHCYLDATTHHLIDARALASLRPGALLINTARGPVVDQVALLEALESGQLGGAGIDVVEREPLDDERLRHHPRVLLTPHSAFYSVEGFVELRTKAAEEVRRVLLGEPVRNSVSL